MQNLTITCKLTELLVRKVVSLLFSPVFKTPIMNIKI